MDDVVAMREVERADDLDRDVEGGRQRDLEASVLESAQQRGEIEAVDVLHGDEQRLADASKVEDLNDVGVGQAHGDLGLGNEPFGKLWIAGELGEDALDRDLLLEPV